MCFTCVASAVTDDGAFTANSNRKFYTPKACDIQINEGHIYYSLLQWDDYMFGSAYYWEGEIRGTSEPISAAYSNVTAAVGSLPYLYKEYDEDDATIGCRDMAGITGNTSYYVGLTMTKGPKYDQGVELFFESEYGIWGGIDGLPLNYQGFVGRLNTKSARAMAWVS